MTAGETRRASGDCGPGTQVDFQAMEDVARAAAAGVCEGTLSVLLHQQAELLGAEQPCPDCGRSCRATSPNGRAVLTAAEKPAEKSQSCSWPPPRYWPGISLQPSSERE